MKSCISLLLQPRAYSEDGVGLIRYIKISLFSASQIIKQIFSFVDDTSPKNLGKTSFPSATPTTKPEGSLQKFVLAI